MQSKTMLAICQLFHKPMLPSVNHFKIIAKYLLDINAL